MSSTGLMIAVGPQFSFWIGLVFVPDRRPAERDLASRRGTAGRADRGGTGQHVQHLPNATTALRSGPAIPPSAMSSMARRTRSSTPSGATTAGSSASLRASTALASGIRCSSTRSTRRN